MKDIPIRILNRIKRFWLIFLIVPIITGGLAYLFAQNAQSSYTATSEIMLGNFQKEGLTHQELMKDQMPNEAFLEKLSNQTGIDLDVKYLLSNLTVSPKAGRVLTFSISGNDSSKVEEEAQKVTDAFLKMSEDTYNQQKNLLTSQIDKVEAAETDSESQIDKEKFLFDLKGRMIDLTPTELNKEVSVATQATSPVRDALLGVIVGLLVSFALPIIPEFFIRNEEN
ncbi:hypothetical protein [Cytobacillus oceanisediminis]|uniref:Polysaccharide chain length determinant N-terminal domain-containing protein n=1 Tax=Cytobacillus oceanisediminis 2691 TaxID=1196031 RepID=A0A160MG15_9BACI|nr:hypothetical protein [Cytobacillus oceanisediminis]AND42237.1 hypothetical protein A361_24840 [Cytobacillus oceanisediminis 2691]